MMSYAGLAPRDHLLRRGFSKEDGLVAYSPGNMSCRLYAALAGGSASTE